MEWALQGLQLVAVLPASTYRLDVAPMAPAVEASVVEPAKPALGRRVLIVEDETLIAMELCNDLASLGWEILGPAATIEEARRLIAGKSSPDVAVLDVNLGGALVYPLAEQLRGQGVPLVFCTGYEQLDDHAGYEDCPIVRKPVNANVLNAELRRLG